MRNIIRGAQWRKWDLHIHSTYSIEPKAKLSIESIFKEAIAKDISVIAITDHSNVNGLDEIWSVWENQSVEIEGKTLKINEHICFFPAIELKANCGKRGVHFIALMPPSFNGAKVDRKFFIENILAKIDLTELRITEAGKGDYNKGLFEIAVDLKNTAVTIHQFGGLISVHAFGKDHNFEDEIAHPKTATPTEDDLLYALGDEKKFLMKNCIDICELNNHSEKALKQAEFYLKTFLKPSILCSDSHESYSGFFTWIKADPTFKGLKQISYEPAGRVCIKRDRPEEKNLYTVIDSVRFVDNRETKDFSDEWIPLNPNLNSIIGGKSSGKSLLLYHIAKTIDPQRIENINNEKGPHKKIEYLFENDSDFDFEVKWMDGTSYSLKSAKKPNRPITFIPQLYLNRLAEDQKDELNQLVHKMLIDSFDEYRTFREAINTKKDNLKADLFSAVEGYYRVERDIENKTKELSDLGDQKAIEENIKIIELKISELRKESEFTDEQEAKYKALIGQRQDVTNEIQSKTALINALTRLKEGFGGLETDIIKIVKDAINDRVPILRSIIIEGIRDEVDKIIITISDKISRTIENGILTEFSGIEKEKLACEALEDKLKSLETELNPLIEIVKNRSSFDEFQKKRDEEAAKLKAIINKSTEIKKLIESRQIKSILDKYADLFSCYSSILGENKKFKIIPEADNLQIDSNIEFSKQKFSENFLNKVDRRTSFTEQLGDCFKNDRDYVFDKDKHLDRINYMIGNIAAGQIALRQGFDDEHAMLSLLDDYFSIDYNLLQDNDDLLSMSPGKRGIILFQLFLHLSKSTNPILIDQPEDNLDNRTVYKELNEFIKAKKSKRQIIIASHNPNLVVSTDAENIIVANQSGQNKSGQNKKYKFEYVNGALENSFKNAEAVGILNQCGIREHVCDILEGGEEAFEKREKKYGLK